MSHDVFTDAAGKVNITGVQTDTFGNPLGNEFDLAKDGAFKGYSIAVLHLYTGEGFDFSKPQAALKEKGFDIVRWADAAPPLDEFRRELWRCCQLWVISDKDRKLPDEIVDEIDDYFKTGHGVYIWGDNDPYFVDANVVGERLLNTTMGGNLPGDRSVPLQPKAGEPGFKRHLITTGLNHLYEGVTVASVQESDGLKPIEGIKPILYGSNCVLINEAYDHNGCRALLDGGFTRLYFKWDTAGTGRYVKNAAAWLANVDQWGRYHHLAPVRFLAGQVQQGNATPRLFFFHQASGDLKIGGYWEEPARGTIAAFDPARRKVKEEPFTGAEHYFTIKDAKAGIWTARATFKKPGKKHYSYVLSIEVQE
jgi:hypothetical protein